MICAAVEFYLPEWKSRGWRKRAAQGLLLFNVGWIKKIGVHNEEDTHTDAFVPVTHAVAFHSVGCVQEASSCQMC